MYCPIIDGNCKHDRCAWFHEQADCCSVWLMGLAGDRLIQDLGIPVDVAGEVEIGHETK